MYQVEKKLAIFISLEMSGTSASDPPTRYALPLSASNTVTSKATLVKSLARFST